MAFADHYGLSLPTEAEWEYVAAGGQQFVFGSGDGELGCQGANYGCYNVNHEPDFIGTDTPDEYIGFRYTVGTYPANPYGAYDMSGNVWEATLEGEDPPLDGTATGGPELEHHAWAASGPGDRGHRR